jgi:hypothetical protein
MELLQRIMPNSDDLAMSSMLSRRKPKEFKSTLTSTEAHIGSSSTFLAQFVAYQGTTL